VQSLKGHVPFVFPPRGRPRVRVLGKWGSWSVFFEFFFRERGKRKAGEGNLLLPPPRMSKGRRRPIVPFKTALFGFFLNSG